MYSLIPSLNFRLWRVSGCHELLASLGFDLMEVGQDQVTLRTGKQANRRNCQFVLQALLALFDTQEAPKSLGLDSSSSSESLNEDGRSDSQGTPSSAIAGPPQQRSVSPAGTVKSQILMHRPPLPIRRAPLPTSGGAFISYVRRRGEPDGGRTETESVPATNNLDTSAANTTDSELSDGYTSYNTLNSNGTIPKLAYSSLRGPVKVSRPGGGGESDAAFTPSPPVTIQNIDNNVSLTLAHQTRIRNLYSNTSSMPQPSGGYLPDNCIPDMPHMPPQSAHRPDSSSSASSTTDWEGSGHATVLRRAHQTQNLPHLSSMQTMPLVDSLRPLAPLAPVYNNLGLISGPSRIHPNNTLESTSSDSEFERGFDMPKLNIMQHARPKLKSTQQIMVRKITDQILMDRLSVRTEITSNNIPIGPPNPPSHRQALTLPEDDATLAINANNLYFAPVDNNETNQIVDPKKDITNTNIKPSTTKDIKLNHHNKNIQESILRHMNREMTPTISEVYHERNLGLGLAPPLSKLLLSNNYEDSEAKTSNLADAVSDLDLNAGNSTSSSSTSSLHPSSTLCDRCHQPSLSDKRCACHQQTTQTTINKPPVTKKPSTKPWLSNVTASIVKASDLTTADILERQNKLKANNTQQHHQQQQQLQQHQSTVPSDSVLLKQTRGNSPFSDLSRRDEGDGRSVADSQCSGSFKVDVSGAPTRSKFSLET